MSNRYTNYFEVTDEVFIFSTSFTKIVDLTKIVLLDSMVTNTSSRNLLLNLVQEDLRLALEATHSLPAARGITTCAACPSDTPPSCPSP